MAEENNFRYEIPEIFNRISSPISEWWTSIFQLLLSFARSTLLNLKNFPSRRKEKHPKKLLADGSWQNFSFFFSGFFVILLPLSSVVFHFLTQFSIRCLLVLFYRFECFRKTLVVVGFIPIFFKSFIRFEYIQIIYKIYFYRFSNPLSLTHRRCLMCVHVVQCGYMWRREKCVRKFTTGSESLPPGKGKRRLYICWQGNFNQNPKFNFAIRVFRKIIKIGRKKLVTLSLLSVHHPIDWFWIVFSIPRSTGKQTEWW